MGVNFYRSEKRGAQLVDGGGGTLCYTRHRNDVDTDSDNDEDLLGETKISLNAGDSRGVSKGSSNIVTDLIDL